MKVLVTGATGFIGRHLVLALKEKGHQIIVLTRDLESAGFHLPSRCKTHLWRPALEKPKPEGLQGVQAVIHLAGAGVADRRWSLARKKEIIRSRVHSTRNLVRALKETKQKPQVFISASAIGFYGDTGDTLADESFPPGSGFLSEVCQKWEKEIFEVEPLGIRTVALRIGFVLGHGGIAMNRLLPPFKMSLGGPLGNGKQWMSWIHAQDVASLICHMIENSKFFGVYNAVAPEPISNRTFTKTLGQVLNRPAVIPTPEFMLKLGLGEMAQLILASQKVSSCKIQESGYTFHYPDLESALNEVCNHPGQEFQTEQWVPKPIDTVFNFFRNSKNLETLTPGFLNFKILSQSNGEMGEGFLLNYRLRLHGIPIHWQSKILDWNPPNRFSDKQIRGPYAYWEHSHEFFEEDGGTVIRDRVVYRLPFSPAADLLVGPFVRNDLQEIFTFRQKKIVEIFGTP